MIIQYKCQNCGADMVFDSKTGKLRCHSCGREDSIESMPIPDIPEGETDEKPDISLFSPNDISDDASASHFGTSEAPYTHATLDDQTVQYCCKNCGAVVLTDKDTAATNWSFCGAPVVLGNRLSGELAPAKIIPFTISKEQAQQAFVKWAKKGRLCPKDFVTADRIKNITGMYVPFWLYDMQAQGDADATCTKVRTYTRGDYIYTETSYYHVYRRANLRYQRIPVDASEKMDDAMMDRIEPFDYKDLKDFNMPYLAGFLAEKYNYDDKQLLPRVSERVKEFADSYLRSTISGYSSVHYNRKDVQTAQQNAFYTLLPVWLVSYDYKDAEHMFIMNGQTGKIVGKPPLSKSRMTGWFLGISGISFFVMSLLYFLFMLI